MDRAIPLHERDPLAVTGLFRSKAKADDPACMGVFMNHDTTVPEQKLEVDL